MSDALTLAEIADALDAVPRLIAMSNRRVVADLLKRNALKDQ